MHWVENLTSKSVLVLANVDSKQTFEKEIVFPI